VPHETTPNGQTEGIVNRRSLAAPVSSPSAGMQNVSRGATPRKEATALDAREAVSA
jgi:hypothetical protein